MEQEQPEISVIVCAYNTGTLLPRCLESITRQTFGNIEIIVVDDCSTDDTLAVAKRYAASDNRIIVLHNDVNRGISNSRQQAIDAASGTYTIHVDADDYIDPDMLQVLYNYTSHADVVICDYVAEYRNRNIVYSQQPTSLSPQQIVIDLTTGRLHGSCCNKLIARRLYTEGGIKFPTGINSMEDLMVNLAVFAQSPRVAYVPQALYHYNRENVSSITTVRPSAALLSHDRQLLDLAASIFENDGELCHKVVENLAYMLVTRAFAAKSLTSKQFSDIYSHLRGTLMSNRSHSMVQRLIFAAACRGYYRLVIPINDIYTWLWHLTHGKHNH